MRSAVCLLLLVGALATGCGAADHSSSSNRVVLEPSGTVVTDAELDQAVQIIRARLDKLGLKDAKISRDGKRVLLDLPGPRRIALIPTVARRGRLEFFDLQGDLATTSRDSNGFPHASSSPLTAGVNTIVVTCNKTERYCPGVPQAPSRMYYYLFKYDPNNEQHPIPEMTGFDLKRRGTRQDFDTRTNEPVVLMTFTKSGAEKFQRITQTLVKRGRKLADEQGLPTGSGTDDVDNQQFAIVLDREMKSAPSVDFDDNPNGIPGKNGAQITGISISDAKDLALVLLTGTLPWEFRIVSE